jgi:hypothetical protein
MFNFSAVVNSAADGHILRRGAVSRSDGAHVAPWLVLGSVMSAGAIARPKRIRRRCMDGDAANCGDENRWAIPVEIVYSSTASPYCAPVETAVTRPSD